MTIISIKKRQRSGLVCSIAASHLLLQFFFVNIISRAIINCQSKIVKSRTWLTTSIAKSMKSYKNLTKILAPCFINIIFGATYSPFSLLFTSQMYGSPSHGDETMALELKFWNFLIWVPIFGCETLANM